jgi:hypothetical protein
VAVINLLAVDRKIEMKFVVDIFKLGLLPERWRNFPS